MRALDLIPRAWRGGRPRPAVVPDRGPASEGLARAAAADRTALADMLGTRLDGVSSAGVARRQRQYGVNAISLESRSIRTIVRGQISGINISFARLATRASLRRRLGQLTYAVAIVALRERPVFSCGLRPGGRRRLIHLAVSNAPVSAARLTCSSRGRPTTSCSRCCRSRSFPFFGCCDRWCT